MASRNSNYMSLLGSRSITSVNCSFTLPSCVVPDAETSPAMAFRMYSKGMPLPAVKGVFNADDDIAEGVTYPRSLSEFLARRKSILDQVANFVTAPPPAAPAPPPAAPAPPPAAPAPPPA